jgi:hypothetical protein
MEEEGSSAANNTASDAPVAGNAANATFERFRNAYLTIYLLHDAESSIVSGISCCNINFSQEGQIMKLFTEGVKMRVPAGMTLYHANEEVDQWRVLVFFRDADHSKVHLLLDNHRQEAEEEASAELEMDTYLFEQNIELAERVAEDIVSQEDQQHPVNVGEEHIEWLISDGRDAGKHICLPLPMNKGNYTFYKYRISVGAQRRDDEGLDVKTIRICLHHASIWRSKYPVYGLINILYPLEMWLDGVGFSTGEEAFSSGREERDRR